LCTNLSTGSIYFQSASSKLWIDVAYSTFKIVKSFVSNILEFSVKSNYQIEVKSLTHQFLVR